MKLKYLVAESMPQKNVVGNPLLVAMTATMILYIAFTFSCLILSYQYYYFAGKGTEAQRS